MPEDGAEELEVEELEEKMLPIEIDGVARAGVELDEVGLVDRIDEVDGMLAEAGRTDKEGFEAEELETKMGDTAIDGVAEARVELDETSLIERLDEVDEALAEVEETDKATDEVEELDGAAVEEETEEVLEEIFGNPVNPARLEQAAALWLQTDGALEPGAEPV